MWNWIVTNKTNDWCRCGMEVDRGGVRWRRGGVRYGKEGRKREGSKERHCWVHGLMWCDVVGGGLVAKTRGGYPIRAVITGPLR